MNERERAALKAIIASGKAALSPQTMLDLKEALEPPGATFAPPAPSIPFLGGVQLIVDRYMPDGFVMAISPPLPVEPLTDTPTDDWKVRLSLIVNVANGEEIP